MSEIISIREKIDRDVFDYQVLQGALTGYSKPRDKITRLLDSGAIVRVKKGLYCFGKVLRREPVSREYLANLIYGPSYVSLEYALSYHGLIPERVEVVTSVTTRRSRGFLTPFGSYYYRILSESRYAVGVILERSGSTQFLMASPEKALIDKIWTDKRFQGERISDYEAYLSEDLRIERDTLVSLNSSSLRSVARAYNSPKIRNLIRYLKQLEESRNA